MLHTWLCIYVHMCEVTHTCKLHLNRLTQNGVFPVVGEFDWQDWRGLADKPAVTASATLKRQMNVSAWMLEYYCFCNVHKLSKRPFYALHFPAPVKRTRYPQDSFPRLCPLFFTVAGHSPSLCHCVWGMNLSVEFLTAWMFSLILRGTVRFYGLFFVAWLERDLFDVVWDFPSALDYLIVRLAVTIHLRSSSFCFWWDICLFFYYSPSLHFKLSGCPFVSFSSALFSPFFCVPLSLIPLTMSLKKLLLPPPLCPLHPVSPNGLVPSFSFWLAYYHWSFVDQLICVETSRRISETETKDRGEQ